jgi:hypothetical protein
MSNLRTMTNVAKSFGATVEIDPAGESVTINVDAPRYQVWKATQTHCLNDSTFKPYKPDYSDLIERMNYGIEPCTDSECEWCNE